MPFVKPSLHHRRSITASSSPTAPATIDVLPPKTPSSPLQPSLADAIHGSNLSEPTLPTSFSFPPPLSRRRSVPTDGDSEGARKRRKKNPTKPEDITKDTPILRPPSSSELSRSCGWETSSGSSSSSRHTEAEIEIMESIEMERMFVSEEERGEVHAAADSLVVQGDITKNQGEVLKDIFDNSFDQPQLYNYLLGYVKEEPEEPEEQEEKVKPEAAAEDYAIVKEELVEHIKKIKQEVFEENGFEGSPEFADDEPEIKALQNGAKESKSPSPEPPRSIDSYKAKSILLDVRNGVGKFALRLREGRDKKTDPTRDSHPRRSRTYRSTLLRRDANRCVITHIRDPLIAAHILPFTIASLDGVHSFWSLLRMMLGPTIASQLYDRYGFKSSRRRGNTGINSPENGWMLRSDLDEYFSRMQCYLEPIPEEPHKYVFHWLDEPADLPMSSKTHADEKRQQRPVETGNIIDLTPLAAPEQGTLSKPALAVPPPPSRALITMQAAIHKLAYRFRGQADVFAPVHGPDSDTLSSLEDDPEEEQEDDHQDEGHRQAMAVDPLNHMYLSPKSIGDWLCGVESSGDGSEAAPRSWSAKRTKISDAPLFMKTKVHPELGLISPAVTTKSEPVEEDQFASLNRLVDDGLRKAEVAIRPKSGVKRRAEDSEAPAERKRKRLS
ncbi:hypothetical protein TWF696_008575 [Orbilia brochopaga]|uniref:HNH nuclease domain-containing protein n=1 Tax=Orbilia brochopaga TaxID=3140254 RepID=A0AAV9UGC3_9PEZI